MHYVELPPRADLVDIVKCVWSFEAAARDAPRALERIVPDGCPELIIHYGAPFAEQTPSWGRQQQPRAFVMGQITRPLGLESGQGDVGVLGVRFHPWGLRALVGAPAHELLDSRLTLDDVLGASTVGLIDEIAYADGASQRSEVVQDLIAARVGANARFHDAEVASWTRQLSHAAGRPGVTEIAGSAGVSLRHFERRFRAQVGMPPRLFANIVRFRSIFDRLMPDASPDWAHLALDAGYFDQPHLIRDFRRFVGCSPGAFVAEMNGLSAALVGFDDGMSTRYNTHSSDVL